MPVADRLVLDAVQEVVDVLVDRLGVQGGVRMVAERRVEIQIRPPHGLHRRDTLVGQPVEVLGMCRMQALAAGPVDVVLVNSR